MKLLCVIFLSLLGTCARAQAPDVSLSIRTSDERETIEISNAHRLPIEAFLVTVEISNNETRPPRIYYDSHVYYKHDLAIPSSGSKQLPLPRLVGGPQPTATLRAVVFSDGSTIGDRPWVDELLGRRTILVERLNEVLSLLDRISEQDLTKDEAITLLQHASDTRRRATASGTPEEQILQGLVFYDAIRNLEKPTPANGDPPALHARIKQISRVFADWLADLESAKPTLSGAAATAATN